MNMELRVQDVELRANEDGTMTVSGYVNKTGQLSNVLGVTKRFVEKIAKGAFARAIQNAQRDIDFLAEHDSKKILASTRNNSLQLREDEEGLYMEATIAPTSWGRDYYELIKSGILRNMSFGFRTIKDSWKSLENGLFERTIEDLELFEVSVVRDPAYSQSTIAARGIDLVEEVEVPSELEEEKRNMEKLQEMVEKVEALEERVNALTAELQELRSIKEEKEEVREEAPAPEVVIEEPKQEVEEKPVEEQPQEEPAEKEEEKEEVKEEVVEEAGEKDSEDSEVSEEKTEEAEEHKEEEGEKEEEKEDDKEHQRSVDPMAELAELRNRLASLK
jgi:HK97 family phage prohead protease